MRNGRETIALVDDSVTNLNVGKNALKDMYDVFTIPSGPKLFELLNRVTPDLILLDIEMPDMNGYDVIKTLKKQEQSAEIPVIFLTAKNDPDNEIAGLSLGAVDFISKPFSPPLLRKRIESHLLVETQKRELMNYNENLQDMIEQKTKTVFDLQNTMLKTVAELVECRDDITGGHIERTQGFLKIMVDGIVSRGDSAYRQELMSWDLALFILSAQLHDVGKIAIRDSILLKPGKLTPEEFDEMKLHTTFGVEIIQSIERSTSQNAFLKYAEIMAGSHHEKWNGKGYPQGLSGEDIPLQGRLMAIVDVYDALTNDRPYKRAFPHEEAMNIIVGDSGTHFDPFLVEVFLECQEEFRRVNDLTNEAKR